MKLPPCDHDECGPVRCQRDALPSLGAAPGSRSDTPETDKFYEGEKISDDQIFAQKMECQRNQLAKLLEREIEAYDRSGDEIGARQLRRAVLEILPQNVKSMCAACDARSTPAASRRYMPRLDLPSISVGALPWRCYRRARERVM